MLVFPIMHVFELKHFVLKLSTKRANLIEPRCPEEVVQVSELRVDLGFLENMTVLNFAEGR